jgi:glycosyltransferase involved in cell wall biosynthesis
MSKIVFLQPGYGHYRDEFFDILSKRFDISVILDSAANTYPNAVDAARTKGQKVIRLGPKPIGIIDALLREKPEVVVTFDSTSVRTFVAFFYATIFRKKIVLWIEQWRDAMYPGISVKNVLCRFRKLVAEEVIARCDSVVATGTKAYEYVLSKRGRSQGVFKVLQCAVDQQKQPYSGNIFEKDLSSGLTFLYLSRIIPWKGLDILIKAFAQLRRRRKDVFLLIAGYGPFKAECEKLCNELKIDGFRFLGALEPAATREIYAQANVFVLPSRIIGNFYEGWGLVINEAMSMGLPVIATDAVAASYDLVVPGFNGLIVPQGSVNELFRAMEMIIEMDLPRIGINSREVFELKNNYEKMANGFAEAILYARGPRC